jgi:hypothetical protein
MSGSDASSGTSGAGLQSLLSKFSNSPAGAGASQFSADGSTPSQFTMPGGQIPQYQGAAAPAGVMGVQAGMQDAQNWTQAVQQAGGLSAANLGQMAQTLGGAAGGLQMPQQQQEQARAPAGARGGSGQAVNFVPQQVAMGMPGAPAQGTTNLGASAAGGTNAQSIQSLLALLQNANKGFTG